MTDKDLEDPSASNCPFCGGQCMYLEHDDEEGSLKLGFRIGACCDESFAMAKLDKDVIGNDFGRTNWCETEEEATKEWNYDVEHSVKKNHIGYW